MTDNEKRWLGTLVRKVDRTNSGQIVDAVEVDSHKMVLTARVGFAGSFERLTLEDGRLTNDELWEFHHTAPAGHTTEWTRFPT
ncbi:hypothetical protein F6X40_09335 [Paraburkholderia sp. UCT31]|uniref:hypothetical protein n=1 Tax=Paraburkholderia sp. UCT31 TaxID=2615209 RepID=UPI00165583BB|nr:hypothetical protein [Paraburkholderia sp. UCT31]MBC8737010.1 hypothetical protein [Paraburkholderia sp. UCT31]